MIKIEKEKPFVIRGLQFTKSVKYLSQYLPDRPMNEKEAVVATEMLIEVLGVQPASADLVAEILIDEEWSIRRLRDAVKHVIKTHKYKIIKPADILSFDKGIEFYSYLEMLDFDTGGRGFFCVKIPGLPNMPLSGEEGLDFGWWIREGTVIPDTWKRR